MTARGDLLVQQFGTIYSVIARNIDGLTHADSLAPAAGGGNTANWILGHLVNVQNGVMRIIGAPPVWESEQLERARFDHPIRTAADAIDWDTAGRTIQRVTRRVPRRARGTQRRIARREDAGPVRRTRPPGPGCSAPSRSIRLTTRVSSAWRVAQPGKRRRSSPLVRPRLFDQWSDHYLTAIQ